MASSATTCSSVLHLLHNDTSTSSLLSPKGMHLRSSSLSLLSPRRTSSPSPMIQFSPKGFGKIYSSFNNNFPHSISSSFLFIPTYISIKQASVMSCHPYVRFRFSKSTVCCDSREEEIAISNRSCSSINRFCDKNRGFPFCYC